jgi:hypothetical protein
MLRIVCVLLLFLAAAPTAHATMVAYHTDEELYDEADVVLLGTVWRRAIAEGPVPFTDHEVEATECFKGCQTGQWIVMHSPGVSFVGPESEDYRPIIGAPTVEPGTRVIMYLKRTPKGNLVPISLGLSVYTLHYHGVLQRYIARRHIADLAALAGADDKTPSRQVTLARDRFAQDFIEALRSLKTVRGER